MRRGGGAACLLAALACSCAPRPPPATPAHYVLEGAWRSPQGAWFYPRERFAGVETGIAEVYGPGHAPRTTDGETYDPTALAGAHQTLQLPAIVRVTDLDTGRQILIRLNDRGPASPARLLAVTDRAATLLGMVRGQPARVRVEVEGSPSRALAEALRPVSGTLAIATAPRGTVTQAALTPPPGVAQSAAALSDAPAAPVAAPVPAADALPPPRLPEMVWQAPIEGVQLWLRGSEFSRADYAARQSAQLAGLDPSIEHERRGRSEVFRVRAGPFATIAEADAALDRARRAGVTDARIVVE